MRTILDQKGTVSLVCSRVRLGGGLVASPCWVAAVSTAADSGVSTSSCRAVDKPCDHLLNLLAVACKF